MSQSTATKTRQRKASRIAEVAAIGSATRRTGVEFTSTRSTKRPAVEPRGIGVLASVSNGLFGGRAVPSIAVIERLSRTTQRAVQRTFQAAA